MIDNYIKIISLTPDVIYDTTVGEIGVEGIYKVFKEYEKLENISAGNLLKNNSRVSFLEIPNQLFGYITSKLAVEEGQLKLASHMHIFKEDRKIILCLPYESFKKAVKQYEEALTDNQALLIRDLNSLAEELKFVTKLCQGINLTKVVEEEEEN